jgi:RNA polymerase sigma-70 factor (ECF subfamily)
VAAFLRRGFLFQSRGRCLQFRGYDQPFDLDSCLHETFVRAFATRARTAYDGVNPYRRYLLTIARNLVLDEHRRREVAISQLRGLGDVDLLRALSGEDAGELEGAPAAETLTMEAELMCLCRQFVGQLNDSERRYFTARFERETVRGEAGKQSGLSLMQARTMEARLQRRFLRFMQANGYLESYRIKTRPTPSAGWRSAISLTPNAVA